MQPNYPFDLAASASRSCHCHISPRPRRSPLRWGKQNMKRTMILLAALSCITGMPGRGAYSSEDNLGAAATRTNAVLTAGTPEQISLLKAYPTSDTGVSDQLEGRRVEWV